MIISTLHGFGAGIPDISVAMMTGAREETPMIKAGRWRR
jgi:hypothetical protein